MHILQVFCIGCVLDMQLILVSDLHCIACLDEHLLDKCSLQSFFNDCSCMIKICLHVYIMFTNLIAFYLLMYVPCIQLVISLMKVLFVCKCFRLQVYTCKCFTTSRLGVSEFCHCSQTHVLVQSLFQGFCQEIAKGGDCKVVIYNYVFCWLLFRAKFDGNFIQSFIPYIYCGI